MRTKDEIFTLLESEKLDNIKDQALMVFIQSIMLEVFIDIRDSLRSTDLRLTEIANTLHKP